ncbi:MAG: hypothetical protein NTT76_17555, partial [Achromobacter xylosoxidans]|nr:hypothetical protein [Achromobacter xylosoxidans]
MSAAAADMATAADMAAASAMPAAAARRELGPAALHLLPHALAIAGVAQSAAAVVGAGAVARGGRVGPLPLRRRLPVLRRKVARPLG